MRPGPADPHVDGRRAADLRRETVRLLRGYVPGWQLDAGAMAPDAAAVNIFAHLSEILISRVNGAPRRSRFAFHSLLGAQIVPARPACSPVRFYASQGTDGQVLVPAGTQVTADGPVFYETRTPLSVVPEGLAAVVGADPTRDVICRAPGGFLAADDPAAREPAFYRTRSLAGATSRRLELDRVAGLKAGDHVELPTGRMPASRGSCMRIVLGTKENFVLLHRELGEDVPAGATVRKVVEFTPFDGVDEQEHILYLRHDELLKLDVGAEVVVDAQTVGGGADLDVVWEHPAPDRPQGEEWVSFDATAPSPPAKVEDAKLRTSAKIAPIKVRGESGYWIRCRLKGKLARIAPSSLPRLAGLVLRVLRLTGKPLFPDRAFANTTAIDFTQGIDAGVPVFGDVPRLFDAFYLASGEAFSKAGAHVAVHFDVAGGGAAPVAVAVTGGFEALTRGVSGQLVQATGALGSEAVQIDPIQGFRPLTGVRAALRGDQAYAFGFGSNGTFGFFHREGVWRAKSAPADGPAGLRFDPAVSSGGIVLQANADRQLLQFDGIRWAPVRRAPPADSSPIIAAIAGVERAFVASAGELHSKPVAELGTDVAWVRLNGVVAAGSRRPFIWSGTGTRVHVAAFFGPDGARRLQVFTAPAIGGTFTPTLNPAEPPAEDEVDGEVVAFSEQLPGDRDRWTVVYTSSVGRLCLWRQSGGSTERVVVGGPGTPTLRSGPSDPFEVPGPGTNVRVGVVAMGARGNLLRFELASWKAGDIAADQGRVLRLTAPAPAAATTWRIARRGAADPALDFKVVELRGALDVVRSTTALPAGLAEGDEVHVLGVQREFAIRDPGSHQPGDTTLKLNSEDNGVNPGSTASGGRLVVLRSGTPVAHGRVANITGGATVRVAHVDSWSTDPFGSGPPQAGDTYEVCAVTDTQLEATPSRTVAFGLGSVEAADDGRELRVGTSAFVVRRCRPASATTVLLQAVPVSPPPENGKWQMSTNRAVLLDAGTPASADGDPQISWEYWNGTGWVVLPRATTKDTTSALLESKDVEFVVPATIRPTEVGGQTNYWVRARFVGGAYVTETFETIGIGTSKQQTVRTLTGIGAPRISRVEIRYELRDGVPPKRVLTWNNLDSRDQTDAALAGSPGFLPFEALDTDGPAVHFAFQSPVSGAANVFLEAQEWDGDRETIRWSGLHRAEWHPVPVEDETFDLTRPGLVRLVVNGRLDRESRFGADAAWIRGELILPPGRADASGAAADPARPLCPQRGDENGAAAAGGAFAVHEGRGPVLNGVHPNTVWVDQVRTVVDEVAGSPAGQPETLLRLQSSPVQDDPPNSSLDLRVLEPLGEEDREALVAELGEGAVARRRDPRTQEEQWWVRWRRVPDFAASRPQDRHFVLDAQPGEILFGDGVEGRVPPASIDGIRAFHYRTGGGELGNCAAGAITSLVSAIAGIRRVVNVLPAAGGADAASLAESAEFAARRLSHGDRAVTLTDFENLACEASVLIERARCTVDPDAVRARRTAWIVVAILPRHDARVPRPELSLCEAVAEYLSARASGDLATGGRIAVRAPVFAEVTVLATLVARTMDDVPGVEADSQRVLRAFLHPVTGGRRGEGWDFGVGLRASDVHAALREVTGLRAVTELSFRRSGTPDASASVDLAAGEVLASGERHVIRVDVLRESA